MQNVGFRSARPQILDRMRCGRWLASAVIAMGFAAALAGCGSGDASEQAAATLGAATVGAAGGTVTGSDGASVTVPVGAMKQGDSVTIAIAKDSTASPPQAPSESFIPVSNVFTITPHGRGFAAPVQVTLPFDASLVRDTDQLVVLKAQPWGNWVAHSDVTRQGAMATVAVRDFSLFMVAVRTAVRLPPALTAPMPFSFELSVSGTPPNLTINYSFSGTRPDCILGDRLETVFLTRNDWSYRNDLGISVIDTTYSELLAVPMPNFPSPATALGGTSLAHAVIQPANQPGGQYSSGASFFTPFVKGRYVCNGERIGNNAVGAPWTLESGSTLLPYNAAGIALREDIPDIQTSVGAPVVSRARVQTLWSSNLAIKSKWEISRDNGATWTVYKLGAERLTLDTGLYGEAAASTAGLWAIEADLPAFVATDNGARLRFSACTDVPSYWYETFPHLECATGAEHTLSVAFMALAPSFTVMPLPAAIVAGAGASFSVVATGLPTPTLQWQRRVPQGAWEHIAGAQAGTYILPATTLSQDGTQYQVVATNSSGSATSDLATLNVVDQAARPTITAVSGPLTVVQGSSAVFAATVSGTAPLSFQWRRNGVDILGANTPILRLDAVADAQAGTYVLHVGNPAGDAQSTPQQLTVVAAGAALPTAPSIVTQPVPVQINAGNTATLAVGASGSGPLAYQWTRNNVDIAEATEAFYTIASAAMSDTATYGVRVSNSAGSTVSVNVILTVNAAVLLQAPVITAQPGGVVVAPGMGATFGVGVQGSGPISYQWLRNGVALPGQTQATYSIGAASALDAGAYQVQASNSLGAVTSTSVQLILLGAPLVTTQPVNTSAVEGSAPTFSVGADGDYLLYQWTRNQVAISGATTSSYTTPAVSLADSGAVFGVIVYNGAGLVFSQGAVLTVTSAAPVAKAWGPAGLIETDNVGGATRAKIAMDASGNASAVWEQADSTRTNIWANRYNATSQTWGVPTLIETDDAGDASGPQIAVLVNGDAVAVWYQDDGSSRYNIWANRYVAATNTWGTATLLETCTATAGSPQIAADGNGNALVVWSEYNGLGSIWAIRYTSGTGWDATAQRIESGSTNSAGPAEIAVGANGDAVAVWTHFDGARNNIWANRYAIATHSWGTAELIETGNAGTAGMPYVAVDSNGNAVAAWPYFDGVRYDIRVNHYSAGTNTWGVATPSLTATATGSGDAPRVAFDAAGNAIVVWAQTDAGRYNIWANRFTPGVGWGGAALIETDDAGDAAQPQIALDGTGNAVAVWYQSDGTRNNIVFNRFTAGAGWGAAAVLETGDGTASRPHVAVNSSGNAIAVWDQHDGSRISIWASSFR